MRKSTLCVGAILLAAATSMAQVSVGWGVHGNAASLDLKERLSSVYGWGYGGGAHVDVNLAILSLRFSGDYTTFAPDQDKYRNELAQLLGTAASGYSVDGGNVNILSATVNLKWQILPIPVVKPYLTGGVGYTQLSSGGVTVRYQGTVVGNNPMVPGENKTSVNLGAGVDLSLGPVSLFIEGRYSWIMTEGKTTNYIPVSVGLTF